MRISACEKQSGTKIGVSHQEAKRGLMGYWVERLMGQEVDRLKSWRDKSDLVIHLFFV